VSRRGVSVEAGCYGAMFGVSVEAGGGGVGC
jgi:hypothetical protein